MRNEQKGLTHTHTEASSVKGKKEEEAIETGRRNEKATRTASNHQSFRSRERGRRKASKPKNNT